MRIALNREPAAPVDAATLIAQGELGVDSMTAPYDIRYSTDRHYLQMRLYGEWDEATFERFAADYRAAVSSLRAHGEISHSMVDASQFGVQPQDIADRFPPLINETSHSAEQRTACVVPSLVNRIQARTGGDLINARYFRSINDAADWLFSDEA